MMTFDEWFNRYSNEVDGFWDQHIERMYENMDLTPEKVRDLMEEVWDARYYTLKVGDI